jgi:acyl carrier protein
VEGILAENNLGQALSPERGVALLEALLGRTEPHLLPLQLDVRNARQRLADAGEVPPLWRALVKLPVQRTRGQGSAWSRELSRLDPVARVEAVLSVVRGAAARVLSLTGLDAVPEDRPFKELGLTSLTALELQKDLERGAGTKLPATLAFDYPTATAVTTYLLERVFGYVSSAPHQRSTDAVTESGALTINEVSQLSDQEAVDRLQEEISNILSDIPI